MLRNNLIFKVSRLFSAFLQKRLSTSFSYQKNHDHDISYDVILNEVYKDPLRIRKKLFNSKLLAERIKDKLGCTELTATKFIAKNRMHLGQSMPQICANLEILTEKCVKAEFILENPWLLGAPADYLQTKLEIIHKLDPRDVNDFMPLINLSTQRLVKIQSIFHKEQNYVPKKNRIYYLSSILDVEPALVSKSTAKSTSWLQCRFERMNMIVEMLKDHEISPMKILGHLNVFQTTPVKAQKRLQALKEASVTDFKLSLLFQTERTFEKNFSSLLEKKQKWGNFTLAEYLTYRIGYEVGETTSVKRLIAEKRISLQKVTANLDFLMIDEKYQPIEIASALTILPISLETIKQRMSEVKSLGYRPSLDIFNYTPKEFEKYLKNLTM